MKTQVLRVLILLLLILAIIAMIRSGYAKEPASPSSDWLMEALPPGIGERCNHSATYRDEIPASPGWDNAYAIDLPAGLDHDVVVCTAFMWDADGQMYHYGFDVGAECQSGLCVAGMDLWKHYYEGKFWFWWEDPPAGGPPVEVVLWFREVNPRENPPGPPATYTPTVTPSATPTGAATPIPDPTQDLSDVRLNWLPLVHG